MKRRKWSREIICRVIRDKYEKDGAVWRSKDFGLCKAVTMYYGSWVKAFEAAGVPVHNAPYSTKDEIISKLKTEARNGQVSKSRITALIPAAEHYYSTLSAACTEAGVTLRLPKKPWTEERTAQELKKYAKRLASRHIDIVAMRLPSLTRAARTYFGSWTAACRAAGVPGLIGKAHDVSHNFGRIFFNSQYYTRQAAETYYVNHVKGWVKPSLSEKMRLFVLGEKLYGSDTAARRVAADLRQKQNGVS